MSSKQSMKNVTGRTISQLSDVSATVQTMKGVSAGDRVSQEIAGQREKTILSLPGVGKATGRWAVVVIGMIVIASLVWRYLIS